MNGKKIVFPFNLDAASYKCWRCVNKSDNKRLLVIIGERFYWIFKYIHTIYSSFTMNVYIHIFGM